MLWSWKRRRYYLRPFRLDGFSRTRLGLRPRRFTHFTETYRGRQRSEERAALRSLKHKFLTEGLFPDV